MYQSVTNVSCLLFLKLSSAFFCLLLINILRLQAQYCTSTATSPADGDIGSVTVNGVSNLSNCNTTGGGSSVLMQYTDYTSLGVFTNLQSGNVVNFTIGITTCGTVNFSYGIAIYIDYNRNGLLTDPNEQVYVTLNAANMVSAGSSLSGSFTVPFGIVPGQTLMRIVATEGASGANLSPCGTYVWGETEDYTVMLGNPITGLVTNATCGSNDGAIDISYSSGTAPYTYAWSNGATTEDIQALSPGAYTVIITDATGNTTQNTFYVNASNLAANDSLTIPACFANNGAIFLNPSGGTAPYTYLWNNGQTGSNIQNLMPGGYSVNITDANGCFLHKAFNLTLSSNCYVQIGGKAFYDINNNCVWDSGEMGVPYTSLHLTNANNNYIGGTIAPSATGDYLMLADTGHYTLHANLPSSYMSIACPSGNNYVLPMPNYGTDSLGLDFPISIPNVQDLVLNLTENMYVPGFNHHTYISYRNAGVIPTAATLTYHYGAIVDVPTTSVPYTAIDTVNRVITWNLGTLPMLSNWEQIMITAHLDTPQIVGTQVITSALINPTTNDITPLDNQEIITNAVVAAFDPNMKEVSPKELTEYGLVDATTDMFHYTIHFQNTGNYMAQFVIVKDSLPADLDMQSLVFEGSSHACQITMSNEREVVFTFNDIYLPDSNSNEPASHGYVSFAVKTKANTPAFTELHNKAAIYFDFNAPVITNEVQNVLYIFPTLNIGNQVTVCETDNVSTDIIGGKAPYQFAWSNGNTDNNNMSGTSAQVASSLQAGANSITATDVYGYSVSQNFNLTTVAPENATFTQTLLGTNTYQFNPANTGYASYFWDFGNGQNSNLVSPTYQYTVAGTYNVTLTVENLCGAVSQSQSIDVTTAIDNAQGDLQVTSYPNPFVEKVSFDFPNEKAANFMFELRDVTGKLIESLSTQTAHIELTTEKLASGTYFWKLTGETATSGSIQKR